MRVRALVPLVVLRYIFLVEQACTKKRESNHVDNLPIR